MNQRNEETESPGADADEIPSAGGERPEPPAETPRPEPATPQSPPSTEPEAGEPSGAASEDPARPVIDDPDMSDLAAPAATVPGRTTSEAEILCPFCGEPNELFLEPGGQRGEQKFVEECRACSRSYEVRVEYDDAGTPHIHTDRTE
ncbi:MAG: CPXCG motif-containing cysteine-rich protein [Gemmatimonadota bacterium]|nr:CPXCG motif-containing cysteine-rich protein [Gemmatimonadota bacterium]